MLFETDRLRMELDIEKLSEISRIKAKEIEHLNERNYELEEKLRQKDFKLTSTTKT